MDLENIQKLRLEREQFLERFVSFAADSTEEKTISLNSSRNTVNNNDSILKHSRVMAEMHQLAQSREPIPVSRSVAPSLVKSINNTQSIQRTEPKVWESLLNSKSQNTPRLISSTVKKPELTVNDVQPERHCYKAVDAFTQKLKQSTINQNAIQMQEVDDSEDEELQKVVEKSILRQKSVVQESSSESESEVEEIVQKSISIQTQTLRRPNYIKEAMYASQPPRYEEVAMTLSQGSKDYIKWARGLQ
ncbi:Hypothetical_protein [Hexamita inflata]|uniref:Hypothetical_protein n=1 Tax=Hexamita inflata TaxID=28002 RepID=A0AA86P9V8_9EUKA|nr:Hypothetical protein HINF_LOCUS21323 [Hexamita inflata]